jgi:hypothetical protein
MRIGTVGALSFLVVASAATANGQSSLPMPARRFGITLGANSATYSGNDLGDVSRRTGLLAGVLGVFPFSPTIALEPEIAYSMKGANASDASQPGFSGSVTVGYVQIPALLRFELAAATVGPKPFLYAGPALAFKANCSFEVHGQGISSSSNCDDVESNLNSTDFSLIGGGGIAFNVGGRTVGLAARYDYSLTKFSSSSNLKNSVLSVLATLEFPSGR